MPVCLALRHRLKVPVVVSHDVGQPHSLSPECQTGVECRVLLFLPLLSVVVEYSRDPTLRSAIKIELVWKNLFDSKVKSLRKY